MSDPLQWRPRDIVLVPKHGTILERLPNDRYNGLPRWAQLSPAGPDFDGMDPDDAILLARDFGGKRLPVIDLEGISGKAPCYHPNGATWAGNCVDCKQPCAPDLRDMGDGAA